MIGEINTPAAQVKRYFKVIPTLTNIFFQQYCMHNIFEYLVGNFITERHYPATLLEKESVGILFAIDTM